MSEFKSKRGSHTNRKPKILDPGHRKLDKILMLGVSITSQCDARTITLVNLFNSRDNYGSYNTSQCCG